MVLRSKLWPKWIKKLLLLILVVSFLPFAFVHSFVWKKEVNITYPTTALVLGAGIKNNSLPSNVLQLRLDKAIEMYKSGKLKKIIVSGDNSQLYHNEPRVMKNYLLQNEIPENIIIEDFGGRRTMDSCYRVKNFFKIDQVVIISQRFHLARAQFLCNSIGLDSDLGISRDTSSVAVFWSYFREFFASFSAIKDSFSFTPQIGSDGRESDL
jgi:SanA protein